MKKYILFFVFVLLLMIVPSANASVILNEIFADPATNLTGDANRDGVRSGSDDEFVELLNNGPEDTDISGWSISDATSTRHIFPSDTVLSPYSFLVVFGGGTPQLDGVNWQVASSGGLGLNNSGDTVSLFNAEPQLIDSVVYDSIGGKDQSITLFPDGEAAEFVLHSTLVESQGALFSPGTSVDSRLVLVSDGTKEEEGPADNPVVPELPAMVYFSLGWSALLFKRGYKKAA